MAIPSPGIHTHQNWLGLLSPVGLVVSPVVLNRLGLFPETATALLADWQQRLSDLLEECDSPVTGDRVSAVPDFNRFCQELLDWQEGDLIAADRWPDRIAVHLEDYDEVLAPTWVIPAPKSLDRPAPKAQMLVQVLPIGTPLDALPQGVDGRRSWEATPQQRFERLLKESEHPIGLLWNGVVLRLVYAPRGESSGYLTFPLEPMTMVAGRPMLAALQMLLVSDRLFEHGPSHLHLPVLLAQSRKEQNEVSTRLAEQVLEALWELLKGFDAAEQQARLSGKTLLGDLPQTAPDHLYGGLITVLLRLVFLLYAEDEALMPADSLYEQFYSVSELALQLRQDQAEFQGAMEGRRGAWARLLSLFRLVYDGGGPTEAYLPARHGELFDPDAYPFLEGRSRDSHYAEGVLEDLPAISDGVVERVLSKLLWLDGDRLSYRALDVEQIGSVYEGIMGFRVETAAAQSLGVTYRPARQKVTITVVFDAIALLAQASDKRVAWLDNQVGVKLKLAAGISKALKAARTIEDVAAALGKRLSVHTPNALAAGALVLQPTAERRRSGSHYTPRSLTEPIVREAFRPWREGCQHKPTAAQILGLKVCDPAMGSGAFLVAVCRYLAGLLVEAWEREGYPPEFDTAWDKDLYARRLVAQRCLYGVDKNPFAANLAKLSLWLVTLSKDLPFTFVDHALKCGDSLVGLSLEQIREFGGAVQLGLLTEQLQVVPQLALQRDAVFAADSRDDAGDQRKRLAYSALEESTRQLRQWGDLSVAAFFAGKSAKERKAKAEDYAQLATAGIESEAVQAKLQALYQGEQGLQPFHWQLEFPEVFDRPNLGFDVFVGNPPFMKGSFISSFYSINYFDYLKLATPESGGQADLCSYFYRRVFNLLCNKGSMMLIATNTIYQGDSRKTALLWILRNKGSIFYAKKRFSWQGAAAVIVTIIGLLKNHITQVYLDGKSVVGLNSFLIQGEPEFEPQVLIENQDIACMGFYNYGDGFIFADKNDKCEPIRTMEEIIAENNNYSSLIHPFLSGSEILNMPSIQPERFVIDFEDMSLEESKKYQRLLEIVEKKVRPEREKLSRNSLRKNWWKFGYSGKRLREIYSLNTQIIVHSSPSTHLAFRMLSTSIYLASPSYAFYLSDWMSFSQLQSRVHEEWVRLVTSTLKDDLRYAATDCFETFPRVLDKKTNFEKVENSGSNYYQYRDTVMSQNNEGLTTTYNRFHDPEETSPQILKLRELHSEMDAAVLAAYGWNDVPTACGFGLDYLDLDDEIELPSDLQDRIDGGHLFFETAAEAAAFDSQIRAAQNSKKKLPWRYRWPDPVRDDVLARLLALNAERAAEEAALGLKAEKKTTTSKGRGRSKKSASPSQMSFEMS